MTDELTASLVGSQGAMSVPMIDRGDELADWLSEKGNEGRVVQTRLKASERVIARVTDGIYRQPASALRELISNAWDADANNVTVLTDAPRFSRIYVRDDGTGMSYKTLARLLHSIGGSAKRREEGQELGVTSDSDPDKSPGGRPLIGKIGIGLFSVSQLARRFRIITKIRGSDYRLVAEVRLRAYSEDDDEDSSRDEEDRFISGDVFIKREYTEDYDAHGTDVILDDVKPRVRDLLRSADRWTALNEKTQAEAAGDNETAVNIRVQEPRYHAGWIESLGSNANEPAILSVAPNLPWDSSDPPNVRMNKLVDAIEREFSRVERPDLAHTLDTYLETLWVLGLSVPVGYVDEHPFELTSSSGIRLFWISNEARGQAQEVPLRDHQTVRDAVQEHVAGHPLLEEGLDAAVGGFRVRVDGVELKRPIRFRFIKPDRRSLENSMLFVGRFEPNLQRVDVGQRGGNLAIEGYLFWNGRVIPKENNGVLIRIRGASGALFDPTFFKYQVSEQTRLRQITSELFIHQGLDAALNIDRESFNFSHPHVQLVAMWVHRAIRQLTNKHKELSARLRSVRQAEDAAAHQDAITSHSLSVWKRRQGSEPAPEIRVVVGDDAAQRVRNEGYFALDRSEMPSLLTGVPEKERRDREIKAQALVRILAAYDVLTDRPYEEQQALVEAILTTLFGPPAQ